MTVPDATAYEVAVCGMLTVPGSSLGVRLAADALLVRARVFGVRAVFACRVHEAEHRRRLTAGLGAVRRLDWLDDLMTLPLEIPIPSNALTVRQQHVIRTLPAGCVDETVDGFVRRLTRPLTAEVAVVAGRNWRAGLVRAGTYGPYCARVLVLSGVPADLADAQVQAGYYGVGLIVGTATTPRVAVAGEPFVPQAHSPAGWFFTEELYHQALSVIGGESGPQPAAVAPRPPRSSAAQGEPGHRGGSPTGCTPRAS